MINPFKIYDEKKALMVTGDNKNDFIDEEEIVSSIESKGFFGRLISIKRINGWFLFLCLVILIIFVKISYLQIARGAYYAGVAEGNRIRVLDVSADRGFIYDRNEKILAENNYNLMLGLVPVDLPKNEVKLNLLVDKIFEILAINKEEIWEEIKKIEPYSYQTVIIKDNLSYEQALLTKIASANHPGLILTVGTSRNYLKSDSVSSLSHILGYLGKINEEDLEKYQSSDYSLIDYLGRTGLELSYEPILKGKKGKMEIEVDALGNQTELLAFLPARAGNNLILSLDLEIQQKLEEILINNLKENNKNRGVAIALNPNNGEILGLVSLPSFNNNIFISGITQEKYKELKEDLASPLFNRAISGTYPSGSIIKPILAAAALQEKLITPKTTFLSTGGITVSGKWFFPDWKAGGHGLTNVYKAISESVNTFFYIIGGGYKNFKGLELDRIVEYYDLVGIGKKLGIDLPSESAGLLPTEEWKRKTKGEDWYIGDTYHLAIGQGDILVTPLQAASWTALIANNGILYRPHLVKTIVSVEENKKTEIQPEILASGFFNPEYLEVVRQGMRRVVTEGSGIRLYDLPVQVAGKTGTAQWSTKKEPHAWFTGFAPYKDPEIVITILVEEGGEGSAIAVSITKEFLKWWDDYKNNVDKSY